MIKAVSDGIRVALRVTPGASLNSFVGVTEIEDGKHALKMSVTAVAKNGEANDAVIKLISRVWDIPKSQITIIKGQTGRNKIVHILGNPEELISRISK